MGSIWRYTGGLFDGVRAEGEQKKGVEFALEKRRSGRERVVEV